MDQYIVTGMSCAACSARVEKAVGKVPGVNACTVSLLTNSMSVEGTAEASEIIAAVERAGYGATPKDLSGAGTDVKRETSDHGNAQESYRRQQEARQASEALHQASEWSGLKYRYSAVYLLPLFFS